MGKVRFLLIMLMILMCSGCGSVKNSSNRSVSKDVKKDISTIVQSVGEKTNNALEVIKTDIVIEEEIMELSKPDSVGKQYPTKITKRKKHSNKQSNKQTDNKSVLQQNNSSVDKSKIKTKTKANDKQETTESKQILYVGIAVGSLAILLLLLWLIRRKV